MRVRLALIAALSLALSGSAVAGELAGVTMDDQVTVDGSSLKLQGMGLRSFLGIKIYVAGLYLASPTSDGATVVAATDGKVVDMVMLRDLAAEKLTGGIEEGFERNSSAAEMTALRERLERLKAMFPSVAKGDRVLLTWNPARGTVVVYNGKELGVIEGQDFANALFACWLGSEPAQKALKRGMLGLD